MDTTAASSTSGTQSPNRRNHPRHAPVTRAAVWFNTGIAIGETCELQDLSLSGFGIRCDEWQLPVILGTEGHSVYCVLLLGEAHFGCMAHVVNAAEHRAGHVGFHFDAIPDRDIRLLEGLIDCMAKRDIEILQQIESAQLAD